MAKKRAITEANIDLIRKRLQHVAFEKQPDVWLDTANPELNNVLGHTDKGLPFGRLFEFSGLESAGKTALTLTLAALAQSQGAVVIWIDLESSFDTNWATVRGLDCDKALVLRPYVGTFGKETAPRLITCQELLSEAEAVFLQLNDPGISKVFLAVDSLASLATDDEFAAGLDEQNLATTMALPKFISRWLRRWIGYAHAHNIMIVLINQLRQNPMARFQDPWYTPGGNGPRFFSHVRSRIRRVGKPDAKGTIQGILRNVKNKVGGEEGAQIGYRIFKDGGIEFVPVSKIKGGDDK